MNLGGVEIVVARDAERAARAAAEHLATAARAGGAIALSGGSTPRLAYELAAELEPDWSRASVWWADERCVAPDDERSNFRLARESLLDRLRAGPAGIHRIRGEMLPEEAADAYDDALRDVHLDLVLLGIGPDGHTASLFPDAPTLEERVRGAAAAEPKLDPFVPRVTMTIPRLAVAASVVFLVVGREKADAVDRAFGKPPNPSTPSSLVRSRDGETLVILDAAAAALLPT